MLQRVVDRCRVVEAHAVFLRDLVLENDWVLGLEKSPVLIAKQHCHALAVEAQD